MIDGDVRAPLAALLAAIDGPILAYFVIVNSWYALLLVSAAREMRTHLREIRGEARRRILASPLAPRISVIAPAYNEEATIAQSVRSLLTLQYPRLEVVVVNDGSKDGTLAALVREFELFAVPPAYPRTIPTAPLRAVMRSLRHPDLVVVDKDNGGKADALNVGLALATGELVCAIDADTLIESDALQRMVRPFIASDGVLAAGGTIRVANAARIERGRVVEARVPARYLAGIQAMEYLRAFLFGRLGWNRLFGNLIVSGAFGLFRRDVLVAVGGYRHDTVGEDMEIVLRARRYGHEHGGPREVRFIPDPVAWTEVPETARVLGRQRDRWHRGLADTLWRHRATLFNPRYGGLGLVVIPYFVFVELLAPAVEAVGLVAFIGGAAFGLLDAEFAVLFFLLAYGYGLILTVATVLLEQVSFSRYGRARDVALLLAWALLENLGYRQLTVWWRLRGLVRFVRGSRAWGAMERRGFATP